MRYQRDIETIDSYDVIVCGGGCAGIAAAISSSRNGAKTLLVERSGVVGGTATTGLVGPFMTSFSLDGNTQIIKGIFEELVRNLEEIGGAIHPSKVRAGTKYCSYTVLGHDHVTPFDPEALKLVALQMLLKAGVTVMLHTHIVDAICNDNKIEGIIIDNESGLKAMTAPVVIDCTGDGDVAARAGAQFEVGRPQDGLTQPMTLFFTIANVDDETVERYVEHHPDDKGFLFGHIVEQARKNGDFTVPRERIGIYRMLRPGVWRVNTTRVQGYNGLKVEDVTKAEYEARLQIYEIINFLKKYVPGFENVTVASTANEIGKRETRRITGEYILTLEDLQKGAKFEDTIALASYPVDIHSPTDNKGGCLLKHIKTADVYEIPYRILLPLKVEGLLMAGRCTSATHEAIAAIRVMPPCFAMGEAAGAAAAIAVSDDINPRDIDVKKLRERLINKNVVL